MYAKNPAQIISIYASMNFHKLSTPMQTSTQIKSWNITNHPRTPATTLPFGHYPPKVTAVRTSTCRLILPVFDLYVNGSHRMCYTESGFSLLHSSVLCVHLLLIAVFYFTVWIYSNAFIFSLLMDPGMPFGTNCEWCGCEHLYVSFSEHVYIPFGMDLWGP